MTIYVITPTRRASAEAVHLMMTHALGEAGATSLVKKKTLIEYFHRKIFFTQCLDLQFSFQVGALVDAIKPQMEEKHSDYVEKCPKLIE